MGYNDIYRIAALIVKSIKGKYILGLNKYVLLTKVIFLNNI